MFVKMFVTMIVMIFVPMIVSCDNDCENVCDDDASVPMSSGEGHLVPMNTKAATTIQAVDKLTISETLFLEIFCNKKQTSDDGRELANSEPVNYFQNIFPPEFEKLKFWG